MPALRLERTWGSDVGRLPAGFTSALLTDDESVVYVFGVVGGRGVIRALDARTGETLRELALRPFACADGRALVTRSNIRGRAFVGFVEGDGVSVEEVALDRDDASPQNFYAWPVQHLTQLDHDAGATVDGLLFDLVVDPPGPPPVMRWYAHDLSRYVEEEPGGVGADGATLVILWLVELDRTLTSTKRSRLGASTGRGVSAVFSDDGRTFWRLFDRPRGGASQERWSLADGRRDDLPGYVHAPARYVAVRDGQPAPLVLDGSGYLKPDAAKAGGPWSPRDASVSPDGRRAARVQWGVLRVADLARGVDLPLCDGHGGAVMAAAFSADGALAATSDTGGEVRVWDLAAGECRWRFEAGGTVDQLVFAPDGRRLYGVVGAMVDARPRCSLRAWDLAAGAETTPAPMAFGGFGRLAVSPDGSRGLLALGIGGPHWIDLDAWRETPLGPSLLAPLPDGRVPGVLTSFGGFADDAVRAWVHARGGPSGAWTRVTLDGRTGAVTERAPWDGPTLKGPGGVFNVVNAGRVALSTRVEGGHELRAFRLDDPARGHCWRVAEPHDALASGAAVCVTGGARGELRVYDDAGAPRAAAALPGGRRATAVAVGPDDRRVLAGAIDGRVYAFALDR
ncbi:MAG: hypothetical protein U0324_36780 [Polyangiales bacterium]